MKCEIDEEFIDDLIESVLMNLSVPIFYEENFGVWGYFCNYCSTESSDDVSPPPHKDDCKGGKLMKKLLNLKNGK